MSEKHLCVGGPENGGYGEGNCGTFLVIEKRSREYSIEALSAIDAPPLVAAKTFRYRLAQLHGGGLVRRYWIPEDVEPGEEMNYLFGRFEAAIVARRIMCE